MTLDRTQQEMVSAAAQAGRASAEAIVPVIRNATVMAVDPTNTVAEIQPDGPGVDQPHPADVVCPTTLWPGDRVRVLYGAKGCEILGRRRGDGDDWHVFGDEDSGAPFLNGWGHRIQAPAAVELGQAGPGLASFRRRSGMLELRGWLQKLTGAANNAVQLRTDMLPENDLYLPSLNGFLESTAIRITVDGLLSSALGDTLLCLDGLSFTVRPTEGD